MQTPRFSDHPVTVERARIKTLNFKRDPDAAAYKTRLSSAVKGGTNFAGHYIIAGWGCGTGCTNAAIIDARTGKVMWPDELTNVDATYGDGYSEVQLDFKKNSRLLIIHGRPGSKEGSGAGLPSGDHYLVWDGAKFKLIKSIAKQ